MINSRPHGVPEGKIDHEAVFHIAFREPLVSLIDVVNLD
jgi:hypothetical protein